MLDRTKVVLPLLVACLVVLSGCGHHDGMSDDSMHESHSMVHHGTGELDIMFLGKEGFHGTGAIAWIYAMGNLDGKPNRCVRVYADGGWSLADESTPGVFNENVVTGKFTEVHHGVWRATGFPAEDFTNYAALYSLGKIRANMDGRDLPRN